MDIDLEGLKCLAQAVNDENRADTDAIDEGTSFADEAFMAAANPRSVLLLIATIERLEAENKRTRNMLRVHDPASITSLGEYRHQFVMQELHPETDRRKRHHGEADGAEAPTQR